MSDETHPQRSSPSDTYALIFLAIAICLVGYLLDFLSGRLEPVYDAFYPAAFPEGTWLPTLTQWALDFPFLAAGGIVATLVGCFAFTLRRWLWGQRHLVLIVSVIWAALGFVGFAALIGFILPMQTVFGHI